MPEENLETMLSYLREHSGRYSLEALRGQLLAAGHSPEAADRAIAEFRAQGPPPEKPAWPLALLVVLADFVLLGVAAAIFVLSAEGWFKKDLGTIVFFGVPALCLAQIVVGVILFAVPDMRRLGQALVFGGLIAPGVGLLAFAGLCLVFF
ncbi:MAG TPA: hypothetical protein VLQ45_00270 [Thermoanaerobaculia bacterium]|nr:hypothetical protein [Thermoanaerobaculia bacterium]